MSTPPPRHARHASGGFRRFIRLNSLVVVTTIVFLIVAATVAVLIDRIGFLPQKREAISRAYERREIFAIDKGQRLSTSAYNFLVALRERRSIVNERDALLNLMDAIFDDNAAVYKIEIARGDVPILALERPERVRQLNNLQNSLLIREFGSTITTIPGGSGNEAATPGVERALGSIRVSVTVPPRDEMTPELAADIERIVKDWRLRLFGAMCVLAVLYLLMLFGILLPIRRVLSMLEVEGAISRTPLLPETHSLLEEMHNTLARDATLARLASELREEGASGGATDTPELLRRVPQLVAKHCGVAGVQTAILSMPESEGAKGTVLSIHGNTEINWYPGSEFSELIETRVPAHLEAPNAEALALTFTDHKGHTRRTIVLSVGRESGREFLLIVHAPPPRFHEPNTWWCDFYSRIAREINVALSAIESRKRLILQEKSKANISLSRNLGHDLTNIIATAKLELLALKQVLAMTPEEIAASKAKKEVFTDSLHSLLNTMKFMQETVNLYRSFAYLSRPKFEVTDLGELAGDVCALFRLSVSSSLRVEAIVEPGLVPIEIEPRLLRLALFNLLTNATDAIKRGMEASRGAGTITVTARPSADGGGQEISVADSGPGIRNAEGRLLETEEISEVFRLGYSTKGEGEGEGLGLNWVQTIVSEFHGGAIIARNRPEGGAEFTLRLPPATSLTADA